MEKYPMKKITSNMILTTQSPKLPKGIVFKLCNMKLHINGIIHHIRTINITTPTIGTKGVKMIPKTFDKKGLGSPQCGHN
tara:strand:+ start:723 stop:962 length:240 start_codon:yes stop_codon:yes gene_type:complete